MAGRLTCRDVSDQEVTMGDTGEWHEALDVAEAHGWSIGVLPETDGSPGYSDVEFTRHGRTIHVEFAASGSIWSISEHRAGTFLVFPQPTADGSARQILLGGLRGEPATCRHSATYTAASHCPVCRARRAGPGRTR
jgi:hypothetical protein